ncbi:PilZ domain-containing protein [Jeotgalibacillus soli]|uniref:PilZ domain-containing protein n=1 Tax=Jeotgalibacillus soli TaxID=889306 RepID=A0A0C2VMB6_9BACL|nr:PilZ domain-containing protein [Jeotgalibacillus soli]KIL50022.1 hypothetical protein KP78_14900 [Jeotgalibacillus soli]
MKRHNRDEAFRFSFDEPLGVMFSISEVNGEVIETSEGEAMLIDLSPSGMKLSSLLSIPVSDDKQVKLVVHFAINDTEYTVEGTIIWRKKKYDRYYYGMQFIDDEEMREELIHQLKLFVKKSYRAKKQ